MFVAISTSPLTNVMMMMMTNRCPPCKSFSPILIEFYKKFAEKEKFEVIFVSSDRSVPSFNEYYAKMPWLAIAAELGSAELKNRLAQRLQISSIPTLVVLDAKTGKFITNNARNEVTEAAKDDAKGAELVKSWKEMEAVPLDEADFSQPAGEKTIIGTILSWAFFILKNPVYIFACLYIYKVYIIGRPAAETIEGEPEEPAASASRDEF